MPQDLGYHAFADSRSFLGIPNFNDVVSNIGFAVVGGIGLFAVSGRSGRDLFVEPRDARPWRVFFVCVALISLGSAWYHWAPSNERLLWDRLPMSGAFMAFCAAVVADRIDAKAGTSWLLVLLVLAGLTSLAYWSWTESLGRGDLRFYGFVQFFPLVLLPFVCGLFRDYRYTGGRYLAWVVAWFGISKILEYFDEAIFRALGGTVSGHSLKHLAAAVAVFVALRMLRQSAASPSA